MTVADSSRWWAQYIKQQEDIWRYTISPAFQIAAPQQDELQKASASPLIQDTFRGLAQQEELRQDVSRRAAQQMDELQKALALPLIQDTFRAMARQQEEFQASIRGSATLYSELAGFRPLPKPRPCFRATCAAIFAQLD
jgi:hypothetical protein